MGVSARKGVAQAADEAHVLAFRQRVQRLEQRTSESLDELVGAIAYVPTPGGCSPYLALRARSPRYDRRLVDRAAFESAELVDLPFARGTTVLAPTGDAPWVLYAARRSHEQKVKPLVDAGLCDPRRLAKLRDAIVQHLADGGLAADDLRARLAEPLSVPLGELGKKAGFPSLFALALRELQLDGLVLRIHREHRLDRDGFVYALPRRPLVADVDKEEALGALAGRYFRAHPASSAAAFAFWAETTVGEARAAIGRAELASVTVTGMKEPGFVGVEQLEDFLTYEPPVPGRLAFVPFRDPIVSGPKDLRGMLHEPHREIALADWRGRLVPAGGGSNVHHHFVLVGGYIAGLWEYDEDTRRVRYATFASLPTRMRRAAEDMSHELAAAIAQELGQARFYDGERGETFATLDEVVARWQA